MACASISFTNPGDLAATRTERESRHAPGDFTRFGGLCRTKEEEQTRKMLWHHSADGLVLALILAFIGAERQWRQRMAGLRTNALVAAYV